MDWIDTKKLGRKCRHLSGMLTFLSLVTLHACAMEAGPSPEQSAERESKPYDDEIEEVQQAIRGGTDVTNGKRGLVRIVINNANGTTSGCTGALIHSFYMITAAHCISGALPGKKEGDIRGFVHYYKTSGTNPILLHDTGAPMYAQILPSFAGDLDTMSDFALVSSWRFGAGWPSVTKADFLPISLGDCAQIDLLQFYGAGVNAFAGTGFGTLRTMPVNIKSCLEHHFFDLRGSAAMCRGDSGGPYLVKLANGVEAIAGLFSNAEGLAEHHCSSPEGARQRATRMTPSKMQWLETRMGAACASRTSNGHRYKECF